METIHLLVVFLLDCRDGIYIGSNVIVASYCKIITGSHDIEDPDFRAVFDKITINNYAWICTGAIILNGVTIGKGAVVCAGAGAPAKIIKYRMTEPRFDDDMSLSWLN